MFIKFIDVYPTLEKFLNLNLNKVQDIIKSLGLGFRGSHLFEIAERLKKEFNGKIPQELSDLKSLKGIGDYGANAILCFAYNQKRPLLDTNFIRLYERVFNIKPTTKTAKNDKFLWQFSEDMLPETKFVEYNYGILDIGGNICTNKNPKCEICPLNQGCISSVIMKKC